jgi:hypothetical protein
MKQINDLDTLALIWSIAVVALMGVFLLHSSIDSTNEVYTTPTGSYESYDVDHVVKGYQGSVSEVTDYTLTDAEKQEMFDSYREQKNWATEYEEARSIASSDGADSFQEAEEDRIEEYCEDEGYVSCHDMKYTCDEYNCYLVTITCEDADYSPTKELQWGKKYGCDEWEVTVDDRSFDIRDVDSSYYEGYGYTE